MTLIIACKRENFAVLASDGLLSNDQRDIAKIACHPSLPIACTVSGLFALPLPTDHPFRKEYSIPADKSAPATIYIHDVLKKGITTLDDLTTEKIGKLLAGTLVPFVNEKDYIACHVAMVKDDQADVGFMLIGTQAKDAPANHGAWGWWPNGIELYTPESLHELLEEQLKLAVSAPINTVDELAAIMRKIVSGAIVEEEKLSGGNRSVGGTPHVAKVTRIGAFPS